MKYIAMMTIIAMLLLSDCVLAGEYFPLAFNACVEKNNSPVELDAQAVWDLHGQILMHFGFGETEQQNNKWDYGLMMLDEYVHYGEINILNFFHVDEWEYSCAMFEFSPEQYIQLKRLLKPGLPLSFYQYESNLLFSNPKESKAKGSTIQVGLIAIPSYDTD